MRLLRGSLVALGMMWSSLTAADDAPPGAFDYYVMALSWTPSWCAIEGDARHSEQCKRDTGFGWTLHGLWPQYESGWPSYCRTTFQDPSRSDTAQQAGLFGTGGLAWHQWKKHGRCSGLSADAYYALSRAAYGNILRPPVFRQLEQTYRLPAQAVQDAFLRLNPRLDADMITTICRNNFIVEVRICLTKDLAFRSCGRDVRRDCRLSDARMDPLR